jgi:short-subunit dehydrogenase
MMQNTKYKGMHKKFVLRVSNFLHMNVIITGASKGIGKAIAEQFAAAGHTLFLCSRNEKQLYDAVADLQTKYPNCTVKAKPVDMGKPAEAKAFGVWCLGFGVPDIL